MAGISDVTSLKELRAILNTRKNHAINGKAAMAPVLEALEGFGKKVGEVIVFSGGKDPLAFMKPEDLITMIDHDVLRYEGALELLESAESSNMPEQDAIRTILQYLDGSGTRVN